MPGRGRAGSLTALLGELESDDVQTRWRAAARLGRIHTGQVAEALAGALSDPEPFVRWGAALALGEVASRATDHTVPVLIGQRVLRASEAARADVRVAAADTLAAWGQRAPLEPLLALARDDEAMVRAAAVRALGLAGGHAPQIAGPVLSRAIEDVDCEVRRTAAHALAWCHDVSAVPALRSRLADPAGLVRAAALRALSRLSAGSEEATILPLLHDPEPAVQAEALRYLRQHGGPGALDALAGLATDPTPIAEATLGALAIDARLQIVRRQGPWQEAAYRWRARRGQA